MKDSKNTSAECAVVSDAKERPMLFSGAMVRAILAGRKTQTRRVCKSAIWIDMEDVPSHCTRYGNVALPVKCPYGEPGDRLWVRESFEIVREVCSYEVEEYDYFDWDEEMYGPAKDALKAKCPRGGERAVVTFMADGEESVSRWRPSIHMPRWASRITLEIVSVRVERLQEISEGDAMAEGIERDAAEFKNYNVKDKAFPWLGGVGAAVRSYSSLWESINGPESWALNPWVWVVEFKRL